MGGDGRTIIVWLATEEHKETLMSHMSHTNIVVFPYLLLSLVKSRDEAASSTRNVDRRVTVLSSVGRWFLDES